MKKKLLLLAAVVMVGQFVSAQAVVAKEETNSVKELHKHMNVAHDEQKAWSKFKADYEQEKGALKARIRKDMYDLHKDIIKIIPEEDARKIVQKLKTLHKQHSADWRKLEEKYYQKGKAINQEYEAKTA